VSKHPHFQHLITKPHFFLDYKGNPQNGHKGVPQGWSFPWVICWFRLEICDVKDSPAFFCIILIPSLHPMQTILHPKNHHLLNNLPLPHKFMITHEYPFFVFWWTFIYYYYSFMQRVWNIQDIGYFISK